MYLDKSSSEIINKFKLSPHPEGGWFREIIRSKNHVTRNDGQKRNNITSIYYLLCKSERSKWHRVNFPMRYGFIFKRHLLIYIF